MRSATVNAESLPRLGRLAHSRAVLFHARLLTPALLALAACGGAAYPDIDEPLPAPADGSVARGARHPAAAAAPARSVQQRALQRADVERVVDQGLGSFLAHVAIEPSLSSGKFTGWSIVALTPPELWRDVDLKPGDVIVRINGLPIERETQAYEAFQTVRKADALEVSYLRQNQLRTLRFAIIGPPSPSLPKASPPKQGG